MLHHGAAESEQRGAIEKGSETIVTQHTDTASRRGGRFFTPSARLRLDGLSGETRRFLGASLAVALLVHSGVVAVYTMGVQEERRVARPPVVEFIVRPPRMTKPFDLRKKRVPKRRLARKVASSKPKMLPTLTRRIDNPDVFGTATSFSHTVDSDATVGTGAVMASLPSVRVTSFKEPEKRVSMQEEFLDLTALDTGKYKALVIQDPRNKKEIRGFVHLALAWGTDLEPNAPRAIPQLVEAINRYTQINARVDDHLFLDSKELLVTPFVYITADDAFELTEKEVENLARYMRAGGFVLADNGTAALDYGPAEACLRKAFKQALGKDARFEILQPSHPVYHSFFDFDGGPPPGEEVNQIVYAGLGDGLTADGTRIYHSISKPVPYLEGIYLGDRLVAIYSDKAYGHYWEREYENEPQLQMGINIVVFALTQQGSIAQQHIDFYKHVAAR